MSAPVKSRPGARPVRVVIDGMAVPLNHAPHLLRVDTMESSLLVDTRDPRVEVEDREPDPVWTDGDVVQRVADDRVGQRRLSSETGGHVWRWGLFGHLGDADVNRAVAAGELRVLRRQADEQPTQDGAA